MNFTLTFEEGLKLSDLIIRSPLEYCDSSCESCSSPSHESCSLCALGLFKDQKKNRCVGSCDNGYYSSSKDRLCIPCQDPNCDTCTEQDNGAICYRCSGRFYRMNKKSCVMDCYYPHVKVEKQLPFEQHLVFNNTCKTCEELSTDEVYGTSLCPDKKEKYYHEGACLCTCPEGYYRLDTNKTCMKCSKGCKNCTSESYCETCQSDDGYFKVIESNAHVHCQKSCPLGFYEGRKNEEKKGITSYEKIK